MLSGCHVWQKICIKSPIWLFPSKDSFLYNLLAVIYDKKLITRIRISRPLCKVSDVKDVASLTTMSSEKRCLTRFPNGSHISKHEGSTHLNWANWHVLHLCGTSWTSPKYTGNIHRMFVAGVVTNKIGIFLSIILHKNVKLYEHSEKHIYGVSLHISFKWRVMKDNIDLRYKPI